MNEQKGKKVIHSPYFWLVLVTSLLFGILFFRFLFGQYAFMYMDIGSDTFDINYPFYCLFSDVFHGEGFQTYYMNAGLGTDLSSYLFQYLNPLSFLVALFPDKLIPWGILLASYARLLLLAIFGYKLMFAWISHQWGSFAGALVWTFSSYIMLWGQHYGFCTAMVMFTIFLYLVHLFIDENRRSYNWLLILWITLMLFTNYYFLYMSGIIGAGYLLVYLLFTHTKPGTIVKKLLGLAGMGLLGLCIGGICLIPIFNLFVESTRTNAMALGSMLSKFKPYSLKKLLTILGRLFSNNTFGVGDDYTGAFNYYEAAMIATSSLSLLAIPYLFYNKKYRIRTVVLTVLSVVLLSLPITGRVLIMNASSQRWSFLICLLQALAIGLFVKCMMTESDKRPELYCILTGIGLTALFYALLYLGQKQGYFELYLPTLIIFGVFLVIFVELFLLSGHRFRHRPAFLVLLLGLLSVELVLQNYPSLNFRESPTREEMNTSYYLDGTGETYQALEETDDSLYRVSKTYESASENDSLVQGYNGLSVYFTTNADSLIQYKDMYGGKGISDNFVEFTNDNYLRNTLLGVKYLLAEPGTMVSDAWYQTDGGFDTQQEIYENTNALPFGYLYDAAWEEGEIEDLSETDRTLAALYGFYFSDEEQDTEDADKRYDAASRKEEQGISLLDESFEEVDCRAERTQEGIRISDMGEDPNVILEDLSKQMGEGSFHMLQMEVETDEKIEMAVYYQCAGQENFSADQVLTFKVSPKKPTWSCFIPGDVTDLRIDVSSKIDEVTISDLELYSCQSDEKALKRLRQSGVSQVRFEDSTYQAEVENDSQTTSMLCIPFLYSEGWQAEVNGIVVPVYNINSGLCGIEVPTGSSQVMLQYVIPHRQLGIMLTTGGLLVYLGYVIVSLLRWNRRQQEVQTWHRSGLW